MYADIHFGKLVDEVLIMADHKRFWSN